MVVTSSLSALPVVAVVTRDICGNAVATYDISLSDISGVFVYTKHKSTPDVSYNTYPQHWDKNTTMKYSDAIVDDNTKIGPYSYPNIKEDLVRHQAQEIFGSYVAADMFQNENELKNEHTIIDVSLNASIVQLLTQSTKTDDDDGITNFTRELLYQLQAVDLNRVSSVLTALNEITKTVTVSNSKFYIDGVAAPALTLEIGREYTFDQSDSTNNAHPFRFYDDVNKSNLYSIGVDISGTPGSAGAYTKINIANSTLASFAYQCLNDSAMGNTVTKTASPEDTVIEIPFIVDDILTIKVIYDPPTNSYLELNKNKADTRSYLINLRIT